MPKLVVKLPFKGRSLRSQENDVEPAKKSSNERVKKYRQKLKNDPSQKEKLEKLKEKKKEENKAYRHNIKIQREQNLKFNEMIKEKNRLRMQKLRKKQRETKRKQTAKLSDMKSKLDPQKSKSEQKQFKMTKSVRNNDSARKRVQRASMLMPKEGEKWAQTVTDLVNKATPRRKSLLRFEHEGLAEIQNVVGISKVGRPTKENVKVKKRLAFTEEASTVWKSKKALNQYQKRKKAQMERPSKRTLHRETWMQKIETFLEDNSRIMPNKKDTLKVNGQVFTKRHLLTSKVTLYKKFLKANPTFDRKFGTFLKMIPKYYKQLNLTCRRVCVCSKDYNIDQKIEALNRVAKQKSLSELKTTSRLLSDVTVCSYETLPKRICVDRKCINCSSSAIRGYYKPLTEKCQEEILKYHQWETRPETYTNKDGKQMKSNRWIQVEYKTKVEDLVSEVAKDMEFFTGHLFRITYQHMMEKQIMSNLPIDQCVAIMDFSENASMQAQDEIESAHWTTKQVTLHPIHIVRHARSSTLEEPVIKKESLIILSDCLSHNSGAVYVFTKQLLLHLNNNPGPCDIKVIHRFTDNCATQYKCKDAFSHLDLVEKVHGVKMVYHYTESGHGKGPSDGLGAAVKKRLERLILGGKVINNAYQAYLALKQTQTETTNQTVLYIPQSKMAKEMPPKNPNLKTIKAVTCSNGDGVDSHRLANTNVLQQAMELSLRDHSEHVDYINNELTLFATSIARKGWQIRGTTPTDGNCAFWAISDQLDRTGGHPYTQTQLRENVVEYIENLSENDKENLAKFLTQSMDSYLHGMRLNGTYADHICLQSLCKMLSMDILVVNSGDDIRLQPTGTSSKTLVLGHLPDLQHYVSLEPLKRFELDDFVAVHLTGDKHRRVYVAKVLDVDENDVKLKFMKQTRSADVFEWPNKEDIAWQPHSDVWCKFDQPELLPGRGLRMKFDMKGLS